MVQYNLKAKNIITSALGMDEYFRVSNYKNAKKEGKKGNWF